MTSSVILAALTLLAIRGPRSAQQPARGRARRGTPPSSTRCSSRSRTGAAGAPTISSDRSTSSRRAKRKQAVALAKTGETVSLAHTLLTEKADDNASPFEHTMLRGNNMDRYAIQYHGYAHSHIDALCHILYKDQTYNGYARADVNTDKGCTKLGIQNLKNGLVTRGVLVDIPRLRNLPYLEPGTAIYVEDLEAWEKKAGVKIASGDALLLRTGRWARREKLGPWNVGQSAAGSARVGRAVDQGARRRRCSAATRREDVTPSLVEGVALPIHTLMITGARHQPARQSGSRSARRDGGAAESLGVHADDQPDAGRRRHRVSAQRDRDVLTGSRFRVQGSGFVLGSGFWVRGSGSASEFRNAYV